MHALVIFGRRLLLTRRGEMLIEFAFVAPLLFLLTLGIVDVGRLAWVKATLSHAARETARYASMHGADSDSPASSEQIVAYAKEQALALDSSTFDVAVSWDPSNTAGSNVIVRLESQLDLFSVGFLSIGPISLSGGAQHIIR